MSTRISFVAFFALLFDDIFLHICLFDDTFFHMVLFDDTFCAYFY